MRFSNFVSPFFPVYENDPTPEEKAIADKALADAAAKGKTFTQDQVNALIATDKRNLQQKNQQLVTQLQQIQESANLNSQEKEQLATQINDLQLQFQTKEQKAAEEVGTLRKKLETETKNLMTDRDGWKDRYSEEVRTRAITDAAVSGEAFNPSQVVALLKTNTRLVEEKDDKGIVKNYKPVVRFTAFDEKGAAIELELSPTEAITRMKEDVARYGNLFKSKTAGGFGGQGNQGDAGDSKADISKMTHEQYRAWRKKNGVA